MCNNLIYICVNVLSSKMSSSLAPMGFGKFDMSCPDICQIFSGPVALSAKWPGYKNGLSR